MIATRKSRIRISSAYKFLGAINHVHSQALWPRRSALWFGNSNSRCICGREIFAPKELTTLGPDFRRTWCHIDAFAQWIWIVSHVLCEVCAHCALAMLCASVSDAQMWVFKAFHYCWINVFASSNKERNTTNAHARISVQDAVKLLRSMSPGCIVQLSSRSSSWINTKSTTTPIGQWFRFPLNEVEVIAFISSATGICTSSSFQCVQLCFWRGKMTSILLKHQASNTEIFLRKYEKVYRRRSSVFD